MSIETDQTGRTERRVSLALVSAAVLCLVASGGLLWWRYGGIVFNDMVVSVLAWCF